MSHAIRKIWSIIELLVSSLHNASLTALKQFFKARTLTENEKRFSKMNAVFWRQYSGTAPHAGDSRYILILPEGQIINTLKNATLARVGIAAARGMRMLFLLPTSNFSLKSILKSFSQSEFVFYYSWRYFPYMLLSLFQALKAYRRLASPDDVLSFETDGINFGDLIYDSVLAGQWATLDTVDHRVFKQCWQFYFYRSVIKDILKRYNIECAVLSHPCGVRGGTNFRYLVRNNIEVIRSAGSGVLMFHKLRTLEDGYSEVFIPEQEHFDYMLENYERFALGAEQFLRVRFNDQKRELGDIEENLAFKKDKHVYTAREEFCNKYNLDTTKKNIFVMLHGFNDFPHGFGWIIYRDFYEWFMVTLEIARKTSSVNWVFKEHPYSAYYPTRDLDLNLLFKTINDPHICFLNRDEDFNAKSLLFVADTVITCIGTAGMEYSAMGKPCILGGRTTYSGFGFTVEPKTDHEYRQLLRAINDLPGLTEEQIKKAKMLIYYELKMAFDYVDPFFPAFNIEQQNEFTIDSIFEESVAYWNKVSHDARRRAVADIVEFLNNPEAIRYINLNKHIYFKGKTPRFSPNPSFSKL
ncbi:MAG: hypothetical protein AB1805_03365 [Nitrospirota bacterium]